MCVVWVILYALPKRYFVEINFTNSRKIFAQTGAHAASHARPPNRMHRVNGHLKLDEHICAAHTHAIIITRVHARLLHTRVQSPVSSLIRRAPASNTALILCSNRGTIVEARARLIDVGPPSSGVNFFHSDRVRITHRYVSIKLHNALMKSLSIFHPICAALS